MPASGRELAQATPQERVVGPERTHAPSHGRDVGGTRAYPFRSSTPPDITRISCERPLRSALVSACPSLSGCVPVERNIEFGGKRNVREGEADSYQAAAGTRKEAQPRTGLGALLGPRACLL